ncbi:Autoinducer 2 sensor kinase/phosphatase LuxQ (plasmid) [Caballeronia sp. SBC1]|uniref:hybrid sensor histidine kinase/response regulator n=1 Tax=Caballeronia sp. SBC1 TaxID=2705548 RepID=UPI00140789AE|nr:hybrid sensor histidine kinase/response regulator [Caballeronia sp. SBC1]QIN67917.1 Autoinducer 2 sensor kinase/phosphatase LuxQ [Caballeronia sp. SBC1]
MSKIEGGNVARPRQRNKINKVNVAADLTVEQMRLRMGVLVEEVAALREAAKEKNALKELVTQLRDANQNLVIATLNAQSLQDEAEVMNRKQQEYLSMLAHELRNPLGPITTAATMLGKISGASPQLLRLQQIISRQAVHMARLLDDLLDAARINSGKVTLLVQPVVLTEVFDRAVETVQLLLHEHGQKLKICLPGEPIVISGDPVRLAQIFSNLLINASKFTRDREEITLAAELVGDNVVVKVSDNGVGIAAELLPSIFDLFTQGPRPLARSEGGLGIGLNIVRNLVHLHKGTVEAHSDGLNLGSIFTVTLPAYNRAQGADHVEPQCASLSRTRRVLLVEDNVDAREAMSTFLELEGHSVSVAGDGETGFLTAVGNTFDVMICDIGLPGMDGIELMQRLRAQGRHKMPFSIALSGYGDALIRGRAKDAGFDCYLVKPADGDALLRLLAESNQSVTTDGQPEA